MRTKKTLLLLTFFLLSHTSLHAEGFYKWTDARGNTQYGDRPPPNVNAQQVNMPKITVIDNYGEQWKPMNFNEPNAQFEELPKLDEETPSGSYSKLDFLAPKPEQAIRANNGDVSAMVSVKPALKKGHQIVFSVDGKEASRGKARTANFPNLIRGKHTASVKIINANGAVVKSSSVSFFVLRAALGRASTSKPSNTNNKKPQVAQANKAPKAPTYQQIRQSMLTPASTKPATNSGKK